MIKGGKGGANTNLTGLAFEKETSLEDALRAAGFEVEKFIVSKEGKILGELAGQHRLYKFLESRDVDWSKRVSSKLRPDEALYSVKSNKLTVVEKKWQQVSGSVDEKLQTSGFKLRQYRKLVDGLGIQVQYVYLLSDFFAQPRYRDVLEYIKESGADYHFKSLPLELLDL
jgi:hypothetical protein